jgi:hypothetical protein
MSKIQAKVFGEMQHEIAARKRILLTEKEQLSKAAARIAEIDAEIAVLDSENAEYADAVSKLPTVVAEDDKK